MNASAIQAMIDIAAGSGTRQAVVTGNYTIDRTIFIPSDFTLILDNAHLTMADGTFCNMFRNESSPRYTNSELADWAESAVLRASDPGRTTAGTDHNIRILGRGRAVLDGGNYNGLCERSSGKNGRPHISVNNLILFTNVDGFVLENLHLRNQRWWAMNFLWCCHGRLSNLDFLSDDTILKADGTRIHGLTRSSYSDVYIKNSDGIDLRSGCHDILIENITGFTEDDTVALTGLNGSTEKLYGVEGLSSAIHNVIIRNVQSAAYCANVRLLNQSGVQLYNILIDGVMDTSADSPHLDRGIYAVRIGDNHLYGDRHSTPEETKNITVRNIYGRGSSVVQLAGSITNLVLDNICPFDACTVAVDNQAKLYNTAGEEITF